MKERENMPEISTAAQQTLIERPDYIKQHINKQKKPVIETCQTCNKQYDQVETNQILTTLPTLPNFVYDNRCLNCIKKGSQAIKSLKQPKIKKNKKILDGLTITYQKALSEWRTLSKEYQALDYQEKMILHHLTKPVKVVKTSTPKKKQSSEQIKKATAMKILGNLTEEQQTAILTLMKKQN